MPDTGELDVVVVGAGFGGLYALHALRAAGLNVAVLEAGSGVGGTWFWNAYPGCRCDIESFDYSYSFSEELQSDWSWSERYPSQPEVLRYLNHVADRFDLRRDIRLSTTVTAAAWDETRSRWTVTTDDGSQLTARFCVMATGCLSAFQVPSFPGLESFRGDWYHTSRWPAGGVDLSGQRIGVIGTGSTGIQLTTQLAATAGHMYVFQRTANFSVPNRNRPTDPVAEQQIKAGYAAYRQKARESILGVPVEGTGKAALETPLAEVQATYAERWKAGGGMPFLLSYTDLLVDTAANDTAADFIRGQIRDIVADPATAKLLCPQGYPVGAKRLCQDEGYFEIYNQDNVTLVDARATPVEEITPDGLRTSDAAFELDAIVLATGFDAVTGALARIDIRGAGGQPLRTRWAAGPRAYLGLMTAGFPNLFMVTGPGSPSVLSNMVLSIEQHVDWIRDCIGYLGSRGIGWIDSTPGADDAWAAHVAEVAAPTLFPRGESYYVGANIPGKPRVFLPYAGGVGPYRLRCDEVAADGYAGFALAGGA